jgi:hypothetical protein
VGNASQVGSLNCLRPLSICESTQSYSRHFSSYNEHPISNRRRITYTDPDSVERTWESGERLTRPEGTDIDGVGVAAILRDPAKPNDEPRIVLQKQWRPPIAKICIEVPAGLMDPDESPVRNLMYRMQVRRKLSSYSRKPVPSASSKKRQGTLGSWLRTSPSRSVR